MLAFLRQFSFILFASLWLPHQTLADNIVSADCFSAQAAVPLPVWQTPYEKPLWSPLPGDLNPKLGMELTFRAGELVNPDLDRIHRELARLTPDNGFRVGEQGGGDLPYGDFTRDRAFTVTFLGENGSPPIQLIFKPDGKRRKVIEVTGTPLPYSEFPRQRGKIQFIFDQMARLGHTPYEDTGGGHVHFDKKAAFGWDGRLLRNFLVDLYFNNPQIHYPFLRSRKSGQAPLPIDLGPEYDAEFRKIIAEYDELYARGRDPGGAWIQDQIYDRITNDALEKGVSSKRKDAAINFYTFAETAELRSVRPQQNAKDLERVYALVVGRLNYLRTVEGLVPIATSVPDPTSQEARARTVTFLEQSRLNPQDYDPFFELGWGEK